jgi:glycerophosphoryl diester phosphodiesterase
VKRLGLFWFLLLIAFLESCTLEDQLAVPTFGDSEFISQTTPLDQAMKNGLDGIYSVVNGADRFGQTIVLKWNAKDRLTILTGQDVSYFVLQAGRVDSVFYFEGYWRSQVSRRTGLARMVILEETGGRRLMGDVSAGTDIILEGNIGNESDEPSIPVLFRFQRPIRPEILAEKFSIIAHRGGGRTADLVPHSENTVELVRIAEWFGSNAVEIDVRLSKDGVPILYHDNTLNPRLVQKISMLGSVEEYTFAQLHSFVRLINGEQIPTLDESLRAIVYETNLKFVWLDSKTDERDLIQRMVPLLQQYTAEAAVLAGQGLRDSLEILVGVPSDEIYDELLRYPSYTSVPSIAEKSLDKARVLNAQVWAPLWSGGINPGDNAIARQEGRRIIVWTLDEPEFVRQYITSGEYDGILSNYPTIVAYYHYVR